VRTPILSATETMTGQKLRLPQGEVALTASRTELPPGGRLPLHKHPWPRFVYIEQGEMEVVNIDAGITRRFQAGEVIVEAIDQWHEGRVIGDRPARVIAFDQAPPGANNMVLKDGP
jgi:quercetin dioxygenase-like cupin family protein